MEDPREQEIRFKEADSWLTNEPYPQGEDGYFLPKIISAVKDGLTRAEFEKEMAEIGSAHEIEETIKKYNLKFKEV